MSDDKPAPNRVLKWFVRGATEPYKVATIKPNGDPENTWSFRTEFQRQRFIRENLQHEPESQTFTFWKQ